MSNIFLQSWFRNTRPANSYQAYFFFLYMSQKLSAELLDEIFKELDSPDLRQCQKVCRTWYRPAHLGFLKQVDLHGAYSIERFLTSLAYNPDPSYFKAVKVIIISSPVKYLFERGDVKDLVTKFPCLNILVFSADPQAFEAFDDEICDALLQTCPEVNVRVFARNGDDPFETRDAMLRLRRVLTSLALKDVEEAFEDDQSALQFVVSFPRLQELRGGDLCFLQFQDYLPVFEQLPYLTKISMNQFDDKENFMERYLSRKTTKEREILLERLARVSKVELYHFDDEVCANSWNFMLKYMTGLRTLMMAGEFDDLEWRAFDGQVITNTTLNILHTTNYKSGRRNRFTALKVDQSVRNLLDVFNVILVSKEEAKKSVLNVHVLHPCTQQQGATLRIELVMPPAETLTTLVHDPATGLELFRRLTILEDVSLFLLYDRQQGVSYQTENYNDMLEKLNQALSK